MLQPDGLPKMQFWSYGLPLHLGRNINIWAQWQVLSQSGPGCLHPSWPPTLYSPQAASSHFLHSQPSTPPLSAKADFLREACPDQGSSAGRLSHFVSAHWRLRWPNAPSARAVPAYTCWSGSTVNSSLFHSQSILVWTMNYLITLTVTITCLSSCLFLP